jgi:hypothetical protein
MFGPSIALGRLRSDRVFCLPAPPRVPGQVGRTRRHGDILDLDEPAGHPVPLRQLPVPAHQLVHGDLVRRPTVEFARIAWRIATGPILAPPLVRSHPRVMDMGLQRSDWKARDSRSYGEVQGRGS